jgi:hypothetical protein
VETAAVKTKMATGKRREEERKREREREERVGFKNIFVSKSSQCKS